MTEIGMLPECPCQGPAVVRRPALLTPLMCTYYVMDAKLFWANSPNIDKHFMATTGNVSPNTPSDRQLPFGHLKLAPLGGHLDDAPPVQSGVPDLNSSVDICGNETRVTN